VDSQHVEPALAAGPGKRAEEAAELPSGTTPKVARMIM
jgi:hypothetical protein